MKNAAHIPAQTLLDARRTIAEMVCDELESRSGEDSPITNADRDQVIEQFEKHIHLLAACIEFTSPALLDDYVRWSSSLPADLSPAGGGIENFLTVLNKVAQQQFPSEISQFVDHYITDSLNSLQSVSPEVAEVPTHNPYADLQREYLACLLATKRCEALQLVLEAVDSGIDMESIYLDIIQAAQQELGRLWQTGQISVAQEHYCTAATQFVMSQLQPYFLTDHSSGKTIVATCVGDELHEVGLRIVTDLLEVRGWNAIYLGANAPAESISQTIVSCGAQVLAVSTTMTQHLFRLAEVIDQVRKHPGCEHVKVMVGGYPFLVDAFLWKRVGADKFAVDGRDAVRIADQLLNSVGQASSGPTRESGSSTAHEFVTESSTETEDDLSRLNNSLISMQRELHKANVQLTAISKAHQEKSEALQRADVRKDEFLAMLAHELRGPLAPMQLAVSLLQMDDLQPSIVEAARETMKRQLRQMSHLVSDLLDASRIAHGKIELKKDALDLNHVIHCAVEIAQPLIQERKQDLVLNLSETPIAIDGDEIRLTQVFANLLTNASKYTPEEGGIWLSAKRLRDWAAIEVRDNGVGIEADLLPEIFSSFVQERRSKQLSRGGLGLGLSLVKQLVELHGGSVKAESQGKESGSVFSVLLPALEPSDNCSSPVEVDKSISETSASRRVLVVEDAAGIARITSILFEKLGCVSSVALNGATAIQKFEEWRPEIVILDLELPDMSGLEVTRSIRQLDSSDRTLIVALTGHDDEKHRTLAKESGCDQYLVKPVDIRSLKELLSHPKLLTTNGSH